MTIHAQGRLGLLGMILALAACGAPLDRSEAGASAGQTGEEQGAAVTQEAATAGAPATTPPSTAPADAAPANNAAANNAAAAAAADGAAALQPVAADASADGRRAVVPDRDSAILRAAGLHFVQARKQWESGACGDPPMGAYEPGAVGKVEDLNGDGRPEALVTEGGTCYGNTGMRFWLLSQQPGGKWTIMTESIAIPAFLATKGVDGFPDIQAGGPGFCFPVVRWNGREYALNRHEYEGKPCSAP